MLNTVLQSIHRHAFYVGCLGESSPRHRMGILGKLLNVNLCLGSSHIK